MNKKLILLIALLTGAGISLHAQQLRFEPPAKIPGEINTAAEESAPLLSPDGTSLFFVRTLHKKNTGGQYAGQDIWMALKDGETYHHVSNSFPAFNTEGNNAILGLSRDGQSAYLMNIYTDNNSTESGISISHRSESGWSAPEALALSDIHTNDQFYSACVSASENVIIVSMEGEETFGKEDLYLSRKNERDGTWSPLINLGVVINTREFETSPFLSHDEKTLFFSSQGHGGYGDADIFMTTRLDDSWTNWSAPVNLGPQINSPAFDAYFTLNPDSVVYFSSNRDGGLADIYASRLLPEETTITPVAKVAPKDPALKSVLEIDRATYEKIKNEPKVQVIQELFFDFDQYYLRQVSRDFLRDIASEVDGKEGIHVQLIGHTDDIGSPEYNTTLSQRRALATKEYLVQLGVPEESIATYWVGEEKPALENTTPENRQKNRRVEVFVSQRSVK